MKLLPVQLSGKPLEIQVFYQKLQMLSQIRAERQPKIDICTQTIDYICYIKEYGSLYCRCENSPGILHGIKLKLSVYIVFYVLPAVHYPVLSQLTGS